MKIGKKQVLGIMVSLVVGLAPSFASTGQDLPPVNEEAVIKEGNGMSRFIEVNRKIEKAVISGYKAVENGVVSGYKAIENGVVSGYRAVENGIVKTFVPKENGSPEK